MIEEPPGLTETIASTLTLELATFVESHYFCTPIEERFERITRLARRALNVPVAAVTLINGNNQWFKSICGWPISQLPLEDSLCKATLNSGQLTVIEDASQDPRSSRNPLVVHSPKFRAYAGMPILNEHGDLTGTFCVYDTKPRVFESDDAGALTDLAAMAQQELAGERILGTHAELVAKLGTARREAMVDPLTRLWNRRGAMVMLEAAIKDAQKTRTNLVIALIDLDNFKRINDSHGHQIGDEVLRKCAGRLIRNVRMDDVVGRIGGDEFLLLITDADNRTAIQVLDRLRARVAEEPVLTRHASIVTTISVGFTMLDPAEASTTETLLERADRALLAAKCAGRDQVKETG